MSPLNALTDVIEPALAELPSVMSSDRARVMLLTICLQESKLIYRRQHGGGPARGLAQFERGGTVAVLGHPASNTHARNLCALHKVRPRVADLLEAFVDDDVLALGFARLLLWTDPRALPEGMDDAWSYYLRNWRPGKPRPESWPIYYGRAVAAVREWRALQIAGAE